MWGGGVKVSLSARCLSSWCQTATSCIWLMSDGNFLCLADVRQQLPVFGWHQIATSCVRLMSDGNFLCPTDIRCQLPVSGRCQLKQLPVSGQCWLPVSGQSNFLNMWCLTYVNSSSDSAWFLFCPPSYLSSDMSLCPLSPHLSSVSQLTSCISSQL